MISQLPGACLRASLVAAMVLAPSLLLAGTQAESQAGAAEAVLLVAFFAGLLVLMEYASRAPSLIEFRDAAPINRIRFATLAATVLAIAIACGGGDDGAPLARLAFAVGDLLGHAMDFPGSPVHLVLWLASDGTDPDGLRLVRVAAGLAYLGALVGVTVFAIVVRARAWPAAGVPFNLYVNLPRFGHREGGDIVRRLRRDGSVDLAIGLCLPYLTPLLAVAIGRFLDLSPPRSDLALVWTMSLWAILPVSFLIRGMALRRLALLIVLRRRRLGRDGAEAEPAFLPV